MPTHKLHSTRKRKMKRRLGGEQNWRCAYCGCALEYGTATLDHVQPVILGGADGWQNLVLACEGCNRKKGGSLVQVELSEGLRELGMEG